ncbi:MAG: hypothetical protein CFE45_20825, partial [Burkholderiales bacterium PBB5]
SLAEGSALGMQVQGEGALLRLSADPLANTVRTNTTRTSGSLVLGAATRLEAAAVLAEATQRTALAPDAAVVARQTTLGAARIGIGAPEPGQSDGDLLLVSPALAAQLGATEGLTLRSFSSIDFFGNANLGSRSQKALTLDAGQLRLQSPGATVRVQADQIHLANTSGGAAVAAQSGAGSLLLQAGSSLWLDGGAVATLGAADVRLQARDGLVMGNGARFDSAGDLSLAVGRLTATTGAEAALNAGGQLSLAALPNPGTSITAGAGAHLTLTGSSVLQAGTVELPAGALTLLASGAGRDGAAAVEFAATATTRLAGERVLIDGQALLTPGGTLDVQAAKGGIRLAGLIDVSGASDVSGPTVEGSAGGSVALRAANGSVALGGQLRGLATGQAAGAQLLIDSAGAVSPGALAHLLASSQGDLPVAGQRNFDGSLQLRNRQGDQQVETDAVLRAHRIELFSDQGRLTVSGQLLATGDTGSAVRLGAGQDLVLATSAQVAAGVATLGTGVPDTARGSVELMTRDGRITLAEGATVTVGPAGANTGGSVLLRAPRQGAQDVAIDALAGHIVGAQTVTVEAVKVYVANTIIAGTDPSATPLPTVAPTPAPTVAPTPAPTPAPTSAPTPAPTPLPT